MDRKAPVIPGPRIILPEIVSPIRKKLRSLLGVSLSKFPGAQPVSLGKEALELLVDNDYYVCEKSDGIRCLLFLSSEESVLTGPHRSDTQNAESDDAGLKSPHAGSDSSHMEDSAGRSSAAAPAAADLKMTERVFLIDRKNHIYRIPRLHFPVPNDSSWKQFHDGTVLDAELIYEMDNAGIQQLKLLVFDCLVCDGVNICNKTLDKRLGHFNERVFKPLVKFLRANPSIAAGMPFQYVPTLGFSFSNWASYYSFLALCHNMLSLRTVFLQQSRLIPNFRIEFKRMELAYGIKMMFCDVIPHLKHGNDGLIFTRISSPYVFGTDSTLLKWKPREENSVDFMLVPRPQVDARGSYDFSAMPNLDLYVISNDTQHPYQHYGQLYVDKNEWHSLQNQPLDRSIVECTKDQDGRWRFLRFRTDKNDPNHISIVQSIEKTIFDNVSKEDLLSNAFKMRQAFKARRAKESVQCRSAEQAKHAAPTEQGLTSNVGDSNLVKDI